MTLRAHDQLVQAFRLRIAKLQKQAFNANSEKIEREIEQLELALGYKTPTEVFREKLMEGEK